MDKILILLALLWLLYCSSGTPPDLALQAKMDRQAAPMSWANQD